MLFVSKEIDRWHKKQTKRNTGIFHLDGEFPQSESSPDKFLGPSKIRSCLDDREDSDFDSQSSSSVGAESPKSSLAGNRSAYVKSQQLQPSESQSKVPKKRKKKPFFSAIRDTEAYPLRRRQLK